MARITVVNDYPEFLRIMEELIAVHGGHDYTGFDGDETTFEQIVASGPQVLIVDLRLLVDGMSGWDVLLLARSDARLRGVPIIVCSADLVQARQRTEEFERIGDVHLRTKPFDSDEMLALIDRLSTRRDGAIPVS